MNKYKLLGMISASLVIVAGAVYLKVGSSFLSPALIVMTMAIFLMGVFSALEARQKGEGKIAAFIPAVCLVVLSLAVFISWLYVIIR